MKFMIDFYSQSYEALSYGRPWNGWLALMVSREALEAMYQNGAGDTPEDEVYFSLSFDENEVATFVEGSPDSDSYTHAITPDENGGYDLGVLGWCFEEADADERER